MIMYPKKNKKFKDKLYTLEEAKRELQRQEESDIYFIEMIKNVSDIMDSCYNDKEFMKKYGEFMPKRSQ